MPTVDRVPMFSTAQEDMSPDMRERNAEARCDTTFVVLVPFLHELLSVSARSLS